MATATSSCRRHFGHQDFDPTRLDENRDDQCPVLGCSAKPIPIPYRNRQIPWCPDHGIRLHSDTFAYWNGPGRNDEARLRNFIVCHRLVRAIALPKGMKAESHRLGYEMSEDALSWNVFVSLAAVGKLREAAQFLTMRSLRTEPHLYLWGRRIDDWQGQPPTYEPLRRVRAALEPDIHAFATEPDILLAAEGEMLICIEAKFGSGNPLAHDRPPEKGKKPTSRAGLISRYLGEHTSQRTKGIVRSECVGAKPRSQLLRNVVFASEMADQTPWHVVNLVSRTQWIDRDGKDRSYADPTDEVRDYLHPELRHCFTFRTWEDLHSSLVRESRALGALDEYLRGKSAHYRRAFDLNIERHARPPSPERD